MSNSGFDHLAMKNPHPKDVEIRFEDEGHRYYLLNKQAGEWDLCTKANGFVSSTGIGAALFPFNAQAAARNIFRGKNFATSPYKDLKSPQDILACWNERARQGTYFHESVCEKFYNNLPIDHGDPEIKDLVPKFNKFAEDHTHLEPYRTEWLVFDISVRVSGSIDMIFKEPCGNLSIYDWKKVDHILEPDGSEPKKYKRIFKKDQHKRRTPNDLQKKSKLVKYSLQLGVYKWILEHNYDVKIKDLFLIRFHENLDTYEKIRCFDLDNEVEQIMEDRIELLKSWPIVVGAPEADPGHPGHSASILEIDELLV